MIEQHPAAEKAGNPDGSVAMYTDHVIHDVVGSPLGVLQGPQAASDFYRWLTRYLVFASFALEALGWTDPVVRGQATGGWRSWDPRSARSRRPEAPA